MSEGNTPTEKYLQRLGKRTFLSLWSYPNPHRPDGPRSKEICDLLIIFPPHVLIFSDKACKFPQTDNLELGWKRWFDRAIAASARQLKAAEKYIKRCPDKIFLDNKCQVPLPIEMPNGEQTQFHRIVVAHDPFDTLQEYFGGGTTSLMIDNKIVGDQHPGPPFVVGDLDPDGSFIHVLNAQSLNEVLSSRDTISDLVDYLVDKEAFLRSDHHIRATGEEEVLGAYLFSYSDQKHKYSLLDHPSLKGSGNVFMPEGGWEQFKQSAPYAKMIDANRVSYFWDELIEKTVHHAREGTQHFSTHHSLRDTEVMYRIMANERRVRRRNLAAAFLDIVRTTPSNLRNVRLVRPDDPNLPYYAFLVLPQRADLDYERYRVIRRDFLDALCIVTRLKYADANGVIGVASDNTLESEDVLYFDTTCWSAELEQEARVLQKKWNVLTSETLYAMTDSEFPTGPKTKFGFAKVVAPPGRNEPCLCGSGKKYKKCHGDLALLNKG